MHCTHDQNCSWHACVIPFLTFFLGCRGAAVAENAASEEMTCTQGLASWHSEIICQPWGGVDHFLYCLACGEILVRVYVHTHPATPLHPCRVCFFPLNSSFVWGQSFNGEVKLIWWNRVCNSLQTDFSRAESNGREQEERQIRRRESSRKVQKEQWKRNDYKRKWAKHETDCAILSSTVMRGELKERGKRQVRENPV